MTTSVLVTALLGFGCLGVQAARAAAPLLLSFLALRATTPKQRPEILEAMGRAGLWSRDDPGGVVEGGRRAVARRARR